MVSGRGMGAMERRWGLLSLVVVGLAAGCVDRERGALTDGQHTVSPAGMQFQRVAVFDGREVEFTLRSVGRMQVTVQDAWVEGPAGQYVARFVEEGPHRLVPGADCQLRVRFTPLVPGDMPATLVIQTDSVKQGQLRVPLSGVGVDAWARISPSRLDFGRIEADSTKTLELTLTNPSDMSVEVTPKLVGADRDEFSMAPVTLAPLETRAVPVTFAPHRVGRKDVALAVTPCRGCADVVVQVAAEALEQAVVAVPPDIDFGAVPLDRDSQRTMSIRNVSTEPATVSSFVRDGKDASFSGEVGGLPLVLQPGETRSWELTYSPGHPNLAEESVRFLVQSVRHPTTEITLRGFGGAPELCVSPADLNLDFGEKPLGSKTFRLVTVKNCGADNGGPLTLLGLSWGDDLTAPDGQFAHGELTTPYTLQQGEEVTFKVFYEPVRAGPASDVLVIRTDAYNGATVRLTTRGSARVYPPCQLVLTPEALDFGTVPPRRGAVLGIKVLNAGGDDCAIKNLHLADDGGGTFRMPGGAFDGLIIPPGNFFSFQVAFVAPAASGRFTGRVQLQQADPANPLRTVELRANVQESCLVAAPRYLDFGAELNICPPPPGEVNFLNACSEPLDVTGVRIGPGTTDGEFTITDAPATLPLRLAPGEAFTVAVDYAARVPGMQLSPLYVDTPSLAEPLLVPLIGESSDRVEATDRFTQQDAAKVDVLFVVDNTPTRVEEQPRFTAALPAFVEAALAKGVDMHAAVTTTGIEPSAGGTCTGGAQGGEAGRFFPVDNSSPRIVTQATPDLVGILQRNSQVGLCSLREEGFEAMRRALSEPLVSRADDPRTPLPNDGNAGFLRSEAALAVVFVGDEDDNSPDAVLTYVNFLQEKKGENQPQRVSVYAIAPTDSGCASAGTGGGRYAEIAARTGGEVLSVCTSDYAPLLRTVANRAFSPQDTFPLTSAATPGSVRVTVDGAPATGWRYDAGINSVVFDVIPAPGARIAISYSRACS